MMRFPKTKDFKKGVGSPGCSKYDQINDDFCNESTTSDVFEGLILLPTFLVKLSTRIGISRKYGYCTILRTRLYVKHTGLEPKF